MTKPVRGRLTILSDNILVEREEGPGEHGFAVYGKTRRKTGLTVRRRCDRK